MNKILNCSIRQKCVNMILFIVAILAFSCQRDEADMHQAIDPMMDMNNNSAGVTLGTRIPNAYSLQNMRAACASMSSEYQGCMDQIRTTHLYIELQPRDTTGIKYIVEDTSIDAFPYPLDYELIGTGEYRPVPSEVGKVYAVVPVNWIYLDSVHYRLLDRCFIPEDGDVKMLEIERKALLDAGLPIINDTKVSGYPSGRISVKNTISESYEGVKHVKVVMNTLVRVRHAYTDNNGRYTCGTRFFSNVNYTLSFQNYDNYRIWKNVHCLVPASLVLGVHHPNGYSYQMDSTSHGWQLSTMHNAADVYYNHLCDHFSVMRPPKELRIWFIPSTMFGWAASTPMWRHQIFNNLTFQNYINMIGQTYGLSTFSIVLPDMFFFSDRTTSSSYYYNMFHELAHASHFSAVGKNYWSNYVTNIVLHLGYGTDVSRPDYIGVGEMWGNVAEYYMYNYYVGQCLNSNSLLTSCPGGTEWYRPYCTVNLMNSIPGVSLSTVFQCLTPTCVTLCDFKNEIKMLVPQQYYPTVDACLQPVCEE